MSLLQGHIFALYLNMYNLSCNEVVFCMSSFVGVVVPPTGENMNLHAVSCS